MRFFGKLDHWIAFSLKICLRYVCFCQDVYCDTLHFVIHRALAEEHMNTFQPEINVLISARDVFFIADSFLEGFYVDETPKIHIIMLVEPRRLMQFMYRSTTGFWLGVNPRNSL
jgi:hypothetical protein